MSTIHRLSYRRKLTVGITDGITIRRCYWSGKFFLFWRANSVYKTVGKWFFCFADRYSHGMGNHRRKVSRRTYSVGNLVGKYFTDVLSITDRRNMSVGKTVNSCCSCCIIWWKTIINVYCKCYNHYYPLLFHSNTIININNCIPYNINSCITYNKHVWNLHVCGAWSSGAFFFITLLAFKKSMAMHAIFYKKKFKVWIKNFMQVFN